MNFRTCSLTCISFKPRTPRPSCFPHQLKPTSKNLSGPIFRVTYSGVSLFLLKLLSFVQFIRFLHLWAFFLHTQHSLTSSLFELLISIHSCCQTSLSCRRIGSASVQAATDRRTEVRHCKLTQFVRTERTDVCLFVWIDLDKDKSLCLCVSVLDKQQIRHVVYEYHKNMHELQNFKSPMR